MEELRTIRELRARKRISAEELAKMVGVSRLTIANWENGKNMPTVKDAIKLAQALDTQVELIAW